MKNLSKLALALFSAVALTGAASACPQWLCPTDGGEGPPVFGTIGDTGISNNSWLSPNALNYLGGCVDYTGDEDGNHHCDLETGPNVGASPCDSGSEEGEINGGEVCQLGTGEIYWDSTPGLWGGYRELQN